MVKNLLYKKSFIVLLSVIIPLIHVCLYMLLYSFLSDDSILGNYEVFKSISVIYTLFYGIVPPIFYLWSYYQCKKNLIIKPIVPSIIYFASSCFFTLVSLFVEQFFKSFNNFSIIFIGTQFGFYSVSHLLTLLLSIVACLIVYKDKEKHLDLFTNKIALIVLSIIIPFGIIAGLVRFVLFVFYEIEVIGFYIGLFFYYNCCMLYYTLLLIIIPFITVFVFKKLKSAPFIVSASASASFVIFSIVFKSFFSSYTGTYLDAIRYITISLFMIGFGFYIYKTREANYRLAKETKQVE